MIIQQWNAATTTRHSYTLTYQFLTDLQTFDFEIFSSDVYVPEVGVATPKFSAALCGPVAEPPFLNLPLCILLLT